MAHVEVLSATKTIHELSFLLTVPNARGPHELNDWIVEVGNNWAKEFVSTLYSVGYAEYVLVKSFGDESEFACSCEVSLLPFQEEELYVVKGYGA